MNISFGKKINSVKSVQGKKVNGSIATNKYLTLGIISGFEELFFVAMLLINKDSGKLF